jgi:hypothetical protein
MSKQLAETVFGCKEPGHPNNHVHSHEVTLVQIGWMRKNGVGAVLHMGRHDDLYSQDEALEPVYVVRNQNGDYERLVRGGISGTATQEDSDGE